MVALQRGFDFAPVASVFEGKFQAPKTQRARRIIPLGPHAVKALKEHQARVARNSDDDLVFGNRKGDPLRESAPGDHAAEPFRSSGGVVCLRGGSPASAARIVGTLDRDSPGSEDYLGVSGLLESFRSDR